MDRQRIIESNRSLRLIKNELEALLEKGIIADDAFDRIQALLPAETPVSSTSASLPTPVSTPRTVSPPTAPLSNLNLGSAVAAPPSYAQSTGGASSSSASNGPPPLPGRNPPPQAPPSKPVLSHAKALYKYAAQDARDCSFDKGDRIAVYEHMNADWWMGKNLRTGKEGIFPVSYVEAEAATPNWNDEKKGAAAGNASGYPAPPGQVDPYKAHAPPMAMANQGYGNQGGGGEQEGPSKTEENTKKFGKKLGNAAIFGAGATIGGKIVNSIF